MGVARRRRRTRPPIYAHIATEGPLGLAARRVCLVAGMPRSRRAITRAFPNICTRASRLPLGLELCGPCAHSTTPGAASWQLTPRLARRTLMARGFSSPPMIWSRGVDHELFRPRPVRPRPAASDLSLCGPSGGRKESRRVLSLDLPGLESRSATGPARAGSPGSLSGRAFPGHETGRGARAICTPAPMSSSFRACTDIVRHRAARSHGERRARSPPFPRCAGPLDVVLSRRVGVLFGTICGRPVSARSTSARGGASAGAALSPGRQRAAVFDNLGAVRATCRSKEQRQLFDDRQAVEAR